jgi:uncharacterized protein (TIRG00374 family)
MRRYISIAISLLILAAIYWRIDVQALLGTLAQAHIVWLCAALAIVVPTTGLAAWRLKRLAPPAAGIDFRSAVRLTLAASALNMVLPSKMGDIAKAHFIRKDGLVDGALALSVTVLEKALDLLALLAWCAFGLAVYEPKTTTSWAALAAILTGLAIGIWAIGSSRSAELGANLTRRIAGRRLQEITLKLSEGWSAARAQWLAKPRHVTLVAATSLLIWFLHLFQIWLFILALRAWAPLLDSLALTSLAILIGLLPFTFAGVGTRDAALIFLYSPFFDGATGAALGVLCTVRYLLPGLLGLPLLTEFLRMRETEGAL